MTNPTNPFNWQMPTASDLVTDLPADFETFGQAVATSMADLLGGTTGQILSKASNTDMDFTWVTSDDANAIQNAIVDAKGDLIAASAADTPARLAVGNNGETLVADSSTSTGLRYQGSQAAGKNAIINGAMDIWQRGTSFSAAGYNADRWLYTGTFPTGTISRIVANGVSGVSSNTKYALRYNTTVAGGGYFGTRIEGAGWGNGQTVTLSFLARNNGASAKSIGWESEQYFGSGGSPSSTVNSFYTSVSIPTGSNFVRYSVTVALPSTAGKTFGTNNDDFLSLRFYDLGVANIDLTELQLEIGSVATSFTRVGGTIQGELAACQRYYWRNTADNAYDGVVNGGIGFSTTQAFFTVQNPVTMRTQPTSIDYSTTYSLYRLTEFVNEIQPTAIGLDGTTDQYYSVISFTTAGSLTQFRPYIVRASSTTGGAYIGISAEL
jgi:hypothetical protein